MGGLFGQRGAVLAGAIAVAVSAAATPVGAFNCAVPAIANEAKKTVCADPILKALDTTEQNALETLRLAIAIESRSVLLRDRRLFLQRRDACRRDVLCLQNAYQGQLKLYRNAERCVKTPSQQAFCLQRVIRLHRGGGTAY